MIPLQVQHFITLHFVSLFTYLCLAAVYFVWLQCTYSTHTYPLLIGCHVLSCSVLTLNTLTLLLTGCSVLTLCILTLSPLRKCMLHALTLSLLGCSVLTLHTLTLSHCLAKVYLHCTHFLPWLTERNTPSYLLTYCTHLPTLHTRTHFAHTYSLCTHVSTLHTLTHFANMYPLCTQLPALHTLTHVAHTYPLTVEVLRQDFVLLQQFLVLLLQGLHFAGCLHPFLGRRPQQRQLRLQLGQLRLLLFQVLSSRDGNR